MEVAQLLVLVSGPNQFRWQRMSCTSYIGLRNLPKAHENVTIYLYM
jgi:hypothetical protein